MAKKSRKLFFELLEDRLTPAQWGIAWPNAGHLSLSFVPDGTSVSGAPSNLFQALNASAPTAAWEAEILRAFQTWAANANINIGVVADGGQPLGASGAVQGDSRFGDVRIAMTSQLSNTALADASPFDLSGSTWAGDMVFNSTYNFGINGAGQYDLYTVALHEAGHVFGFADETSDPQSVNYAVYTGPRTDLASQDVAALQSLYGGPRSTNTQGNNSLATAAFLAQPDQAPVNSNISSLTDAQYYSFTTPAASIDPTTGMPAASTSFTVLVKTAGLSLLEPNVTVFDASGNVVGSGAATDPLNNNVTVQISNALPGATYYVEVTGAPSSVFGIGSYQMSVLFPTSTTLTSPTSAVQAVNNSLSTAQVLTTIQVTANSQGFMYTANGAISSLAPKNYYKVVAPTLPVAGTELLTVTAASTDSYGLNPYIKVYNAWNCSLASTVINNGNGTFTVQLSGVSAGAVYYIAVSALPGTSQNIGSYTLATQFNNDAATTFTQLASSTLSQSTIIGYQSLTVAQSELVQFSLSASTWSTVNSAVRMTIYDQNNNQVFTMVAFANQPLSTVSVFLQAGMYTVRYNAATQIGICVPSLAVILAARQLSNPMDPLAVDPTLSGTGIGSTGISVGSSTGGSVGTLPLISPYSNPIVGSSTNSTTTSTTTTTTTTTTSTTNTIASITGGLLS